MRSVFFVWAALLASLVSGRGQVSIELQLEQDQLLRDESLPVKVRINNRSGQALTLGKEADWLTFEIENQDKTAVKKSGEVPVQGEFILESASAATRQVDLMPYFDLSKPGRYFVTANLRIKQWSNEVISSPKRFEIIPGVTIWAQEVGLPGQTGALPEVRKYALQQAQYLKHPTLYVRVSDAHESTVFRVVPVGPMVSFGRPEAQVDRDSNLHLLFQSGARAFLYTVVSPEGQILSRQTHDYASTRPVLRASDNGEVSVKGGQRRLTQNDLPRANDDSAGGKPKP